MRSCILNSLIQDYIEIKVHLLQISKKCHSCGNCFFSSYVKIVIFTVVFVAELISYAFVGVSLSDAKFMGGEYFNLLVFAPLCNGQKKHTLNKMLIYTALGRLRWSLWKCSSYFHLHVVSR